MNKYWISRKSFLLILLHAPVVCLAVWLKRDGSRDGGSKVHASNADHCQTSVLNLRNASLGLGLLGSVLGETKRIKKPRNHVLQQQISKQNRKEYKHQEWSEAFPRQSESFSVPTTKNEIDSSKTLAYLSRSSSAHVMSSSSAEEKFVVEFDQTSE